VLCVDVFHQQQWSGSPSARGDSGGETRVSRRQTVHVFSSGSRPVSTKEGGLRVTAGATNPSSSSSAAGGAGREGGEEDRVEIELANKRRKSFDYSELSNASTSSAAAAAAVAAIQQENCDGHDHKGQS
jgi:hypothetical protein